MLLNSGDDAEIRPKVVHRHHYIALGFWVFLFLFSENHITSIGSNRKFRVKC